MATLAAAQGLTELIVPRANASEAAALEGVTVIGVDSLREALAHLRGIKTVPAATARSTVAEAVGPDLAEVRGHAAAKRALEIAAAGGHNLVLIGPPGSGKTMLARRLPGLLPPLSREESITVTKIQSIAGDSLPDGLVLDRPFRNPHTDTSTAGLVGGTGSAKPGEVTLAHCGVLFLDELPEFRRDSLEALRQPIEDGRVTIVRARRALHLSSALPTARGDEPLPCGFLGDPRHECRCTPFDDRALSRAHLGPAARSRRPARRGARADPRRAAPGDAARRAPPSPSASPPRASSNACASVAAPRPPAERRDDASAS